MDSPTVGTFISIMWKLFISGRKITKRYPLFKGQAADL
jgi:hypothetical protein